MLRGCVTVSKLASTLHPAEGLSARALAAIVCCSLMRMVSAMAQEAPAPAPEEPAATPVRSLESKFDLREMSDSVIAQYDKDPIGRIAGEMGTVSGMLGEL